MREVSEHNEILWVPTNYYVNYLTGIHCADARLCMEREPNGLQFTGNHVTPH